ncbi:MAG: rhodanese-like domain-containing protein [Dehalogenimonas sp.]|uniref:Rhodanese-like domain-containing protein n=1 Tax=Candidatus Dehalogenimonas loeffleri TaxID=3127115 RepID=A0ABZ2J3X9_9CHLR|nr:rhodanese-like domain-containing protein [Dehalogenimonas sp.]
MRRLLVILLAGLMVLPLAACGAAAPPPDGQTIRDLSVAEAYSMIQDNQGQDDFVILDVRTPAEFAEGHIEGAVLLDFNAGNFEVEVGKLDKDVRYLVYCRTSNRSGQAVNVMKNLGFQDVSDMDGGIVDWQAAGYPVVK